MSRLLAVLQIKCRRKPDFWMWLKWYCLYLKCDKIMIIDDDSPVSIIDTINEFRTQYNAPTEISVIRASLLESAPDRQCRQLRNANIGMLMLEPKPGDIVITPDDDEFWWFDANVGESFVDVYYKSTSAACVTVPWMLISSKTPMKSRAASSCYADVFDHVAPNDYNETKFILKYSGHPISGMHYGHDGSVSLSTGKPNTGFGHNYTECPFSKKNSMPFKCYHFRTTTEAEYNAKMKRNINDKKHTRFYAKGKTFYNFDKMMYKNWPGYTVQDDTVMQIMSTIVG